MFRQRAGHVNWKRLTSVNVDSLLSDIDDDAIAELNGCMDNLTFARFTIKDVENNSCDAIVKLVQLMQLIIEYLLCSQESQAKLLVDSVNKNKTTKKRINSLIKEADALREDVKIYKKQLSLIKSNEGGDKNYRVVLGEPAAEKPSKHESLIKSFLNHEESTRIFMKGMLEEQRATFMREIAEMTKVSSPAEDKPNSWTAQRLKSMQEREEQLDAKEKTLREELRGLLTQQSQLKDKEWRLELRENEFSASREREQRLFREREEELEALRRKAKESRDQQEAALAAKASDLRALEAELRDQLRPTSAPRSEVADSTASFIDKLQHSQLVLKAKMAAASALRRLIGYKMYGSVNKAFLSWKRQIESSRLLSLQKIQRDLSEELVRRKNHEAELEILLQAEQRRVVVEQARFNTLRRQVESDAKTRTVINAAELTDASIMTSIDFSALPAVSSLRSVEEAEVKSVQLPAFMMSATSETQLMQRAELEIQQSLRVRAVPTSSVRSLLAEEILKRMEQQS